MPWVVSWVCEGVFAGGLFFFLLTVHIVSNKLWMCVCAYWIEHRLSEKEKVKVPFEWAKLTKNKRSSLLMMMMTTTTSATTTTAKEKKNNNNDDDENTNWLKFKLCTLNIIISYSRNIYTTREVYSMAVYTNEAKKEKQQNLTAAAAAHMLIWWSIANRTERTKNRVHKILTKAMATVTTTLMMAMTAHEREKNKCEQNQTITEYMSVYFMRVTRKKYLRHGIISITFHSSSLVLSFSSTFLRMKMLKS